MSQGDSRSLARSAAAGGRWGFIRSVALQSGGLATTAVLTRILSTADYGAVATVTIVVGMFQLLTRVGFGSAIIRREEVNESIVSSVFWGALTIGSVVAGLSAILSRPVAALAGDQNLAPLVALGALAIPLDLAASVGGGLMMRTFRFRASSVVAVTGVIIRFAVAVPLALLGWGAWAVVWSHVIASAAMMVLSVLWSGFRIRWMFDPGVIREDLRFNASVFAVRGIEYGNKNADYWFIGNQLGASALGTYYVAFVVPNLLRQRVTGVVQDVLLPIAASMRNDPARICTAYERVIRLTVRVLFPAMLGFGAVAPTAMVAMFGATWAEAGEIASLLALSGLILTVAMPAASIFPALDRPLAAMPANLLAILSLIGGLSVVWALDSGIAGVAWAVVLSSTVLSASFQYGLRRVIGLPFVRTFRTAVVPLLISVSMAIAVRQLDASLVGFGPWPTLALVVPFGAGLYLSLMWMFDRSALLAALRDARMLVKAD